MGWYFCVTGSRGWFARRKYNIYLSMFFLTAKLKTVCAVLQKPMLGEAADKRYGTAGSASGSFPIHMGRLSKNVICCIFHAKHGFSDFQ